MAEIIYRQLAADDCRQIKDFMESSYRHQEPLTSYFSTDAEHDMAVYLDAIMDGCVEDGLSFVAVDSVTKRVVACVFIASKPTGKAPLPALSIHDPKARNMALMFESMKQLYVGVNLFEQCNCNRYAYVSVLTVSTEYQHRGIASKLVEKGLQQIMSRGLKAAIVEATNRYSQRIFAKNGFEAVTSIQYKNYYSGGKPVKETENFLFHKQVLLMIKKF